MPAVTTDNQENKLISGLAAADLTGKRYHCVVKNATTGQYALQTAAGGRVDGILVVEAAAAGRAITIHPRGSGGTAKVLSGGTCTAGTRAAVNAEGKAVNTDATDDLEFGEFVTSAGDEQYVEVQMD